ncbi:MAG: Stf0 family sulfotransferase [Hyphomonadaceae bacterium]
MIELSPKTPLAPIEKRTLIIAMTERSGSTNLCSVLSKLGPLGAPEEYFNPDGLMARVPDELGAVDASDYLQKLADRAEIFCFKISVSHWKPFRNRAKTIFPNARYVFLDRLDLEAQAISLYRARASWVWHRRTDWDAQPHQDGDFDPVALEACRTHLLIGKEKWAEFFFVNDIKPLNIMYEHMLADMPKAVQMICGEAGMLVFKSDVPGGEYKILRDALTDTWKERLEALRTGGASAK